MTLNRTRDLNQLVNKAARSRCVKHPGFALLVLEGHIRCGECPPLFQCRIESIPSETEKFMTGQTQSAAIHSKMSQKHGAWDMNAEVTDVALIEPTQTDIERVGNKFADQIEHFGATGDAQLSRSDVILAAKLEMAGFQGFHFYVDQRRYKSKQDNQWHVKASLRMNIAGRTFNAQRSMGATYGGVTIEIITDEAIREASAVPKGEVLVKATLSQKAADGTMFIREEEYGRAGGPRDANQPVAKANPLEMAMTRAKSRVLEKGCALGVQIETYDVVGGVGVAISDGPEQVKALTEADAGAQYPAEDGATPPENVDAQTGEVKPTAGDKAQELVRLFAEKGITKEQVDSIDVDPIEMLKMGSEPDFIAEIVSARLNPPEKVIEGGEDVEELPW